MATERISLKERIMMAADSTLNYHQTGEEIKIRIYDDVEAKVIKDALARMADEIQLQVDEFHKSDQK